MSKTPVCPKCGCRIFKIGQLSFNHQDYDAKEEEWDASYDHCLGETDYQVSAECRDCGEDCLELLKENGFVFYDEKSFKVSEKKSSKALDN